jgi:two-component system response regulator
VASHKILVIDDSKVIQRMVKDMLPPGNFDVIQALDGEEGLKQIKSAQPNLIMLDFLLPKVSGWEVFQQLEKFSNAQGKMIPLVLMSGRKPEVTEKIPEPFEYFEFIEKPFQQKQLINAIKTAMAKAKDWRPTRTDKDNRSRGDGEIHTEIQAMQKQIAAMQNEINTLKKQLTQVVTLIKQKIK